MGIQLTMHLDLMSRAHYGSHLYVLCRKKGLRPGSTLNQAIKALFET